jgi:hypothetical protein
VNGIERYRPAGPDPFHHLINRVASTPLGLRHG